MLRLGTGGERLAGRRDLTGEDDKRRLSAHCGDFKETAARIAITIKLDGETIDTLNVARRHAAIVVRLINGLPMEEMPGHD